MGGVQARVCLKRCGVVLKKAAPARAGYVLAEMSVQQTRAHFLRKYGALVDRPEVGARTYCSALAPRMPGRQSKPGVKLGSLGYELVPRAVVAWHSSRPAVDHARNCC